MRLDDQEITYQRAGNDRHEMRNGLYRNMEAQRVRASLRESQAKFAELVAKLKGMLDSGGRG